MSASALYFGLDGLRREFRRPSQAGLEKDITFLSGRPPLPDAEHRDSGGGDALGERLDHALVVLKWLNIGNRFAEKILGNLEPRPKPAG